MNDNKPLRDQVAEAIDSVLDPGTGMCIYVEQKTLNYAADAAIKAVRGGDAVWEM